MLKKISDAFFKASIFNSLGLSSKLNQTLNTLTVFLWANKICKYNLNMTEKQIELQLDSKLLLTNKKRPIDGINVTNSYRPDISTQAESFLMAYFSLRKRLCYGRKCQAINYFFLKKRWRISNCHKYWIFILSNIHLIRCSKRMQKTLKELYRIGKKHKSWRSQINIKLTRSNGDDSRKHPFKYFCLKFHLMRNKENNFAFWVYRSVSVLFIFVWHRCNAKIVIGFSLFSRDPDGRSISNFYMCVISLCKWWIT